MLIKVFWILLALAPGAISHAKESVVGDTPAILAQQFVEESGVSGLAVSIAMNGEIVWSKGFGFADLEQMVAVDPARTKFRVGSTAKSMTAMALAMLYESGSIDLDAPIQSYVPDFPEKSGMITTRMLAGHTAGIRHYKNDQEFLSAVAFASVTDSLGAFSEDPVLFQPGSQYSYSTQGYIIVSAVIEGATGQDYLTFMSENVFKPIGMLSTVADRVVPIISDRSRYYTTAGGQLVNTPWVDNSNKWASGGFLSTSEDLVRFGAAHLSGKLLKPETIQMMWTSQTTTDGRSTGYGIGWNIRADDVGRKLVRHSGGSVGGVTELRIYPDHELVIALVTNTAPARLTPLADSIVEALLK